MHAISRTIVVFSALSLVALVGGCAQHGQNRMAPASGSKAESSARGKGNAEWDKLVSNYVPPKTVRYKSVWQDWSTPPVVVIHTSNEFKSGTVDLWVMEYGDSRTTSTATANTDGVVNPEKCWGSTAASSTGPTYDYYTSDNTLYVRTCREVSKPEFRYPIPWPVVIGKFVGAGAEGTEFIIQTNVDGDVDIERVIFIDGKKLSVGELDGKEPLQTLTAPGTYVDYSNKNKLFTGPKSYAGTDIEKFVTRVRERAQTMGVDCPPQAAPPRPKR